MAVEQGLTTSLIKAQEIDYVNQFGRQFQSLQELLGIHEVIPMRVGDTLNTYTSRVTLAGGDIAPGDIIPLSEVVQEVGTPVVLEWDKHRKAVPVEDIQKYGYERAVRMTDNALVREVQKNIRTNLINNLATGTGTATGEGLQPALANAWGKVQVAFEDDAVETIAFVNPMDVADYQGQALIVNQSVFGMSYLEGFLGLSVVFMNSLIPEGTAYVTAARNLQLAYASVGGEIARAFPGITTDNTGVIGIYHDTQHERMTAETVTIAGLSIFAERLDGVVVGTIEPAGE